ncbi:hypothetical protein BJP36_35750 [Moorena producens JHB]|uniref:Uncharacterized protein n=1 Tax=Moorena producens (strain JHB) TaxID=1454205 RepID=A0A9Q9STP1_MOOP1|nr:hypothetical protein [Moorena producens]WAN69447.1 hypothetical protein BJP36_35750 [Moorena producens JHB]
MEGASWWNGHLGRRGILVKRASWWNGHLGGTGILVEWVSCPFQLSGGQDAHSTPIRPLAKINMKSKSIPFAFCLLPFALRVALYQKP